MNKSETGYRLSRIIPFNPDAKLDHVYRYDVNKKPGLILNFCFPDAFAVSWPTKLTSAEFVYRSAAFLKGLPRDSFIERPPAAEPGEVILIPGETVTVPATYSGHGQNNIYVSGSDNKYPECYIPFEDLSNNQLSDGVTEPDFLMTKSGYKIPLGKNRFVRINAEYCNLIFGNEPFFSRSFTFWSHHVPDIDVFYKLFEDTSRVQIPKEAVNDILSVLLSSPKGEKVFPQ
jgi:hypothetical protein